MTLLLLLAFGVSECHAQDLEPRRWSQMPVGVNFLGIGYGHIEGDIFFDPVLLIEGASFDMENFAAVYIRSIDILGKSARIDFTLPYKAGRWEGTVDGEYVRFHRHGWADPRVRVSMLLYGGPAQTPREFAGAEHSDTVVGAAVSLTMPFGKYSDQRLINLGTNQWIVRPQLGVTHRRGKWTGELTGSAFIYTDNDDFWRESELETDPLFALQAHLIYSFRPGLWASLSTGYGWGGEATVNGDAKNNPSGNWLTALSLGFPINRKQGVKLTWLRGRTQKSTGADIDSLILGYSMMF